MKISDRDTQTTAVFVLTGVAFLVAAVLSRQLWMAIFGSLYSPGAQGLVSPALATRTGAAENAINLTMYIMPSAFACLGAGLLASGLLWGVLSTLGAWSGERHARKLQARLVYNDNPDAGDRTHHE